MKTQNILVSMLFTSCFLYARALPVSTSKTILIEPATVRYYASFILSSATINDLTVQFGTGATNEELLRVPIAAPGELLPQAMIRITVGMIPTAGDSDPQVGISDGVNSNDFYLVEDGSPTSTVNPCEVVSGTNSGRSAPHGNPVAGTYTMLFDPIHKFGTCSTNTGFATAAQFSAHVDPSKGLDFVLHRHGANEQYTFHYFLVEFL